MPPTRPRYDRSDLVVVPKTPKELYRQYYCHGLNDLAALITEWREGKGFDSPSNFDDTEAQLAKLALIHSEVSEAVQEVRKGTREGLAEELADIIIRVLDSADAQGVDIAAEIAKKMVYNESRPHKHGARA